jgi:hypothetical protein
MDAMDAAADAQWRRRAAGAALARWRAAATAHVAEAALCELARAHARVARCTRAFAAWRALAGGLQAGAADNDNEDDDVQ